MNLARPDSPAHVKLTGPGVAETAAHGVMFHHFNDARHPKGQGAIDAQQFADLLRKLGLGRFLPADEWIARTLAGKLADGDLCITFDDALRCQYDVALPVLKDLGLTAFFFVYSSVFEGGTAPLEVFRYFRTVAFPEVEDFYAAFDRALEASEHRDFVRPRIEGIDFANVYPETPIYTPSDRRFRYLRDEVLGPERYEALMWQLIRETGWEGRIPASLLWMDDGCLRELAEGGHVLGLHSYTHPTALAYLSLDEQRSEYERNRAHLLRATGRAPSTVSHPCNSYRPETLALLREMGVTVGFRANMALAAYSPLEQPRIDHAMLLRQYGFIR